MEAMVPGSERDRGHGCSLSLRALSSLAFLSPHQLALPSGLLQGGPPCGAGARLCLPCLTTDVFAIGNKR